jgi:hypothetical protein
MHYRLLDGESHPDVCSGLEPAPVQLGRLLEMMRERDKALACGKRQRGSEAHVACDRFLDTCECVRRLCERSHAGQDAGTIVGSKAHSGVVSPNEGAWTDAPPLAKPLKDLVQLLKLAAHVGLTRRGRFRSRWDRWSVVELRELAEDVPKRAVSEL